MGELFTEHQERQRVETERSAGELQTGVQTLLEEVIARSGLPSDVRYSEVVLEVPDEQNSQLASLGIVAKPEGGLAVEYGRKMTNAIRKTLESSSVTLEADGSVTDAYHLAAAAPDKLKALKAILEKLPDFEGASADIIVKVPPATG